MKWSDPKSVEAIRLSRKFFPECKAFVSEEQGLSWEGFVSELSYSCDVTS